MVPPAALVLALLPCAPAAITFEQAMGLAAVAPTVTGAARALAAKRGFDRKISRLTWNPQLLVQPGFRLLPDDAREPELIAEAVQPWSLAGHGAARLRAAFTEEGLLAAEARAAAVAQKLDVARAWIDAWATQEVLATAQKQERVAAELERLIARAAALGALTRADVADARAFHAEARLNILAAEGESFERGLDLARETALGGDAPLRAEGALPSPALPPEADWPRWVERAGRLPAVEAAALRERVERARQVEVRAANASVMAAGLSIQRDAPGGFVVSAILRATPAVFDRGERDRGTLAAATERLAGERRQAEITARVALTRAMHEVQHNDAVVEALRGDLLPASREGADARRRIFEAGEATVLEVLHAERLALGTEIRLHRAVAAQAWARVKLWLLLAAVGGAR